MLQADSIVKKYGNRTVLSDVYLTCDLGEIVGLIGRNGTGKSTLLQIIFGSLSAESRFVKVDERVLFKLHNTRNLIAYLPQENFLPAHLSVKAAVKMYCTPDVADKLCRHPFLAPWLGQKSRNLSGGERRLVEVLLILFSKAKYLLLDEPFNGIAPLHREEIKKLIQTQSEQKGIVLTDHDYKNVLDTAHRSILLHEGAVKEIHGPDDLRHWGYVH